MTAAYQATWLPATAEQRHGLAREALAAADRTGEPRHEAIARYLLAAAAHETGRIEELREQLRLGRIVCETNSLTSPLVALGWMEAPWLAMRDQVDDAWRLIAATTELLELTSMPHKSAAPAATSLIVEMLAGGFRPETIGSFSAMAEHTRLPMHITVLWMLVRSGRLADARERYRPGMALPADTWMSVSLHSQIAEVAAGLADGELGARVYRWLVPFAGTPAAAAGSSAMGPVDTYLALAAAAAGQVDLARGHADDAERLCARWAVPRAAAVLVDARRRYGF